MPLGKSRSGLHKGSNGGEGFSNTTSADYEFSPTILLGTYLESEILMDAGKRVREVVEDVLLMKIAGE